MKRITTLILLIFYPAIAYAADMSFGAIAFVPGANALNATMSATDGSIVCNNPSDYTCPANGTRGSFLITGTTGAQVQIRCAKTAKVSNGTTVLSILSAQARIGAVTGTCNGPNNTIITHTISSIQANNMLYNAGRLRVPNDTNNLGGAYSSANAGGISHRIRLIYI